MLAKLSLTKRLMKKMHKMYIFAAKLKTFLLFLLNTQLSWLRLRDIGVYSMSILLLR